MEHIKLLRKIAWSFHHTTGLEWDELFAEASLYYTQAMESYDPDKGVKFTTHLWNVVCNSLKTYLDREQKHRTLSIDDTNLMYQPSKDPIPFWEGLTAEAQEIADYILRNSMEFVCLMPEDVDTLINIIFKKRGWSEQKIRAGLSNLKRACNLK